MVGGLLVATSVVGIFAAYQGANGGPSASYVVVAEDLAIGTPLDGSVLELSAIDLPRAIAARAYRDPSELVGQVTVAPLADGDLVQASSVVEAGAGAPAHELSFALDTDRVVNGRLDAGERVDVLVTYGTGTDAFTEAVVRNARVSEVDGGDGTTFTTSGRTVLTLALPQGSDALALTHAVRAGEVTVVRTTVADPSQPAPDQYRPAPDDTAAGEGGSGGDQGQPAGGSG